MSAHKGATVAALSEDTMCVVAPTGAFIDGGLGPDSLAVGCGYVLIGPVHATDTPGVFVLGVSDEAGVGLCLQPADPDSPDPIEPDDNAPMFTLDNAPAWSQVAALQTAIDYCVHHAAWKHPQVGLRRAVLALINEDPHGQGYGDLEETVEMLQEMQAQRGA